MSKTKLVVWFDPDNELAEVTRVNFDDDVLPILTELQNELSLKEEKHGDIDRFLRYTPTVEDKQKIFDNMLGMSVDYNRPIKDEDVIRDSLRWWILVEFSIDC